MSDWNERALARRNARQAPAVSEVPPVRSTKNTRKFCRGKPGVEHKLVVRNRGSIGKGIGVESYDKRWLVRHCSACGKEVDHWFPMGILRREPPAWVTEFLRSEEP